MKKKLLLSLALLIGVSTLTTFTLIKLSKKSNESKETISKSFDDINDFVQPEEILNDTLNPYTGEELKEETYEPFMAIIENSRQARPQSGLSQADILYETMVEGGITRFIGVFNANPINKIGPIRSARRVFLDIISEYDLPFAHCGGSYDSLDIIENNSTFKSLNEMKNSSTYIRDNSRVAPHNLYTSTENLDKLITSKELSTEPYTQLKFDDEYWENKSLKSCNSLDLDLSFYYSTSYLFTDNGYIKSMDGTECIDSFNDEPLIFNNIILQITDIKKREDNSYMDVTTLGSGKLYVISNGKLQEGTWSKKDITTDTKLLDSSNNEIPLGTGNTIWHIIDTSNTIKLN
ncbi:MAG: DUF3048 domain-containing protein [Sarcina sp.]